MSHALAVQVDPHLKFARYVDAVLVSGEPLDTKAIRIKSAAALYVGECQAREMRAYEAARTASAQSSHDMPRYVERHNPLAPPPPAVVAPASATTEFEPMTPDSEPAPEPDAGDDTQQPQPDGPPAAADPADTTPIAAPKTTRKPAARSTTRPLPKPPSQPAKGVTDE